MPTKDEYFNKHKHKLYIGPGGQTYFLFDKSGSSENLRFRRTPAGRISSDDPNWTIHNSLNEPDGWYNSGDGSVDGFRLKMVPPYTATEEQIQEYNEEPMSKESSTTGGKKSRKASRKSKKEVSQEETY